MKLWGKRFEKETSALAQRFTSGRDMQGIPPADEKLIPYDIWGSRAHVVMLAKQEIIPRGDACILIKGLKEIESSWRKGDFTLDPAIEDVHSNVESHLIARYGLEAGGKLHTARSRNDQIVLDMRLYIRECGFQFILGVCSLIQSLVVQARKQRDRIAPGYTHHQPAQITTLGHIWLSFAAALVRDVQRFQSWHGRFNRNPLGSMTGYGTSFAIDRRLTSKLLGFEGPCENSLDPIQNRWEPEAEMAFAITALMNHLSCLAQTLILFTTGEFGIVKLDEAYSTGSSMMPQKRNPDTLEAVKAKASIAQGLLVSLISLGRGLFLGYNRDTQWTKYLIMDLVDECSSAPTIMREIVGSLQVNDKRLADLCRKGFIAAPDLLEKIVQEGKISFRQGKGALEKAVKHSEEKGAEIISSSVLKRALKEEGIDLNIDDELPAASQDPHKIISRRKSGGGPSPQAMEKSLSSLDLLLSHTKRWLVQKRKQISSAQSRLAKMEQTL